MNLSLLSTVVSEGLIGIVFGDVIMAGIVLMVLFMVAAWMINVPMDAAIAIILPLFFAFGAYSLLPMELTIIIWVAIGFVMFLIYQALWR